MWPITFSVVRIKVLVCCLAASTCILEAQQIPPRGSTKPNTSALRKAAARALREGNELRAKGTKEAIQGAVLKYEEALTLSETEGNSRQQAEAMSQLALARDFLGDRQRAVQLFQRALELWKVVRDYQSEATTLIKIGDIHFSEGEPEKALPYYQDALPLWGRTTFLDALRKPQQSSGSVRDYGKAVTLDCIAQAYLALGDTEKAAEPLHRALRIWTLWVDYRYGKAVTLQNIGYMHYLKREPEEALKRYGEALKLYRPASRSSKITGFLLDAAIFGLDAAGQKFSNSALRNAAEQLTRSAMFWFRQQPGADLFGEATTLNNMGLVYESLGDLKQALEYYDKALTISQQDGNRIGQALASANLSGVYASLAITGAPGSDQDAARAIDNLEHALNLFMMSSNTPGLRFALERIGTFDRALGKRDVAVENLDRVLRMSGSMGDRRTQAITLTNIGELRRRSGDDAAALDAFRQAEQLAQAVGDYRTEAFVKSNIGGIYEARGEQARALELYDQSISLHERARSAADLDEVRTRFAEQSAIIYRRAVLLHARSGDIRTAFDLSERARARTFLDQMGRERIGVWNGAGSALIQEEQKLAAELTALERRLRSSELDGVERVNLNSRIKTLQEAYQSLLIRLKALNPEYASLVEVDPLTSSQIQELLDRQTTLLSYFVTEEETLAFVMTKDDLQLVHLSVRQEDLEAETRLIFADLNATPTTTLRRLYDWLVAPLEYDLHTNIVGIVPHSILHRLPFAALTDGLRYMGDMHALFSLPSGSILRYLQEKRKPFVNSILAVAYSSPKTIGLPHLPYADHEVTEIAQLYGAKPLIGISAKKSTVESQAGDFGILHIAAHARNEIAQPGFSHLVLAGDDDTDDLLTVHDIYRIRLKNTSMVVLSACNTALGKQTAGDEILGLSRAFIYAGSPTVISSLWQVPDDSTQALMVAFYRHLRAGETVIQALRSAQADVRAQRPHPYYWAGFVVSGNPDSAPTRAAATQ